MHFHFKIATDDKLVELMARQFYVSRLSNPIAAVAIAVLLSVAVVATND